MSLTTAMVMALRNLILLILFDIDIYYYFIYISQTKYIKYLT